MSQCPKCAAILAEDYGMVTCSSCGAILFVDIEGVAHMGSDAESAPEAPEVTSVDVPSETPQSEPPPANDWLVPMEEPLSPSFEPEAPSLEPMSEPAPPAEGDFSMDAFLGYEDPTPPAPPAPAEDEPELGIEPPVPDFGPADDPLGINEYANSEISQAKDGLLVFRVFLSGIDTKEIRESIREAISDSRFGWDVPEILGQIEKGRLSIENVSPVKASILINRMKKLPIRIRWEQYAITQAENP